MKKRIFLSILTFIVILVLIGAFGYLIIKRPSQLSITKNTLPIKTGGGEVLVNDFSKKPVQETPQGDMLIKDDPRYHIVFFSRDQAFLITLLQQPANEVREQAEKDFLETLRINKEDACRLNVSLTVPRDVDINLAGGNYHLSFCPDGVAFE